MINVRIRTSRLPPELVRHTARISGRTSCQHIRSTNKLYSDLVTCDDVVWAEAGERLHRDGSESCWKWAVRGGHLKVVEALVVAVNQADVDWGIVEAVGSVETRNDEVVRIAAGDKDILSILLASGGDARAVDEAGKSALLRAVEAGQTGIVRLLLKASPIIHPDINKALSRAVEGGENQIALLVLRACKDLSGLPLDVRGLLLYGAEQSKSWDLVVRLINKGVRTHNQFIGRAATIYFAGRGDLGMLQRLDEAGVGLSTDVLTAAAKANELATVKRYLHLHEERRLKGPLQVACRNGYVAVVEALLPVSTKEERNDGLICAAREGRYIIANELIKWGVDLRSRREALAEAAGAGHSLVFQLLFHPDAIRNQPLPGCYIERAVEGGNLDIVRKCLTFDNQPDDLVAALGTAGRKGSYEIAKLILEGSGVAESSDLASAFWDAGIGGNVELLRDLWERGVDVRGYDNKALRSAACEGHAQAVKALLEMGADRDSNQAIALRTAVRNGHVDVVEELIAAGAQLERMGGAQLVMAARVNRDLAGMGEFDRVDEYGSLSSYHLE